ncbi:MAG: argininosuccinate lyase [Peptococcaceae bacterium]|nr:argininosuccinate lyase [Peptococcaceae bacterium]
MSKANARLWGGRFEKETDGLMLDFHSSIRFDQKLYLYDIRGSQAHARMLGDTGVISQEEADALIRGLDAVLADIEAGTASFTLDAEDIHMNVETLLTAKIGQTGKKLHTARSRNDQVALDTRMYAKDAIGRIQERIRALMETLLSLAETHAGDVMPGYTHLQIAQPVTLGHHLMAYFEMFKRDSQRLRDAYSRTDVMPLGAGALAGTTFPIDRRQVARELGFGAVSENSMDAVSDRDYILEIMAAGAILMTHLSRLSEEIVLWASQEWGFIRLDDAHSTGSSIMPQKKNPDVAELIRGKSGRVFGSLMGTLAMMKGLPLAYNKDMQEDKEAFFDMTETVEKCLAAMTPLLAAAEFRTDRMAAAAARGFSNATDLADYLVGKGLAFRDAHHTAGTLVARCVRENRGLEDLSLAEMREALPPASEAGDPEGIFAPDVYGALKLENVAARRNTYGGAAPAQVRAAVERAKKWMGHGAS